jgi:hypothetical protein
MPLRIERELLCLSIDDLALERERKLLDARHAHLVGIDKRQACLLDLVDLVAVAAAADADDLPVEACERHIHRELRDCWSSIWAV